MKKLIRRLFLLGALAGAAYAARNYLRGDSPGKETVHIVFDDGLTRSLSPNTVEVQELTDIAQKIVEIGL